MRALLFTQYNFAERELLVLKDAAATKQAILDGLEWLLTGISNSDRVLFHFSGHGAQMPSQNLSLEIDGLDEVICPVDFDWSSKHALRDKEFVGVFGKVPVGAECIWVSDSCHSGDLVDKRKTLMNKALPGVQADYRARRLSPPEGVALQIQHAKARGIEVSRLAQSIPSLQVALVAGCQSDEVSIDQTFDGRPNGALTYFLLRNLKTYGAEPLNQLVPRIVADLNQVGASQHPVLEGAAYIVSRPFLNFSSSAIGR
jgi:hypothetical protein